MNKPALHFFGDSFTAGDEVVDYKFMDNYPRYYSFNDWIRLPNRERPDFSHLTDLQYQEMIKQEKQNSYAGLLKGVNHGICGASLQTMSRLIIEHLETSEDKSVIFIQPSGIERWCEYVDNKWIDFNSTGPSAEHKEYYKFKVMHSTEESNLITWHNNLLTLIAYVSNHKNTVNWWIVNNGTFNELSSLMQDKNLGDKIIKNTFSKLQEKIINFPQVDDMDKPYYCIGGHVNQLAHKELAQNIEKLLQ